jgi:hypothetical protein
MAEAVFYLKFINDNSSNRFDTSANPFDRFFRRFDAPVTHVDASVPIIAAFFTLNDTFANRIVIPVPAIASKASDIASPFCLIDAVFRRIADPAYGHDSPALCIDNFVSVYDKLSTGSAQFVTPVAQEACPFDMVCF